MKYSPILLVHIFSAIAGLLSGYSALFLRKGAPAHRRTGNVFFVSMLLMSLSGAYLAAFVKPNMGNVFGGVLAFYLVATGWLAAIRKERETGIAEIGLLLVASAQAGGGFLLGWQAANRPDGLKDGYPAAVYFVFGGLASLFAAWDVRMLLRGGVSEAVRVARHLWRMCFALLIAAASFFLGKQQHFPEAVRHTQLPILPVYLVGIAMIFWLVRVRFTSAYRKRQASVSGGAGMRVPVAR